MSLSLQIIDTSLLKTYSNGINVDLKKKLSALKKVKMPFKFDFYEVSASTYSSNIEGNTTSLDSFLRFISSKAIKRTKEIKEIEDLVKAYAFAKKNQLSRSNFMKTHALLSKELVIAGFRGKLRKGNVVVGGKDGITYVAIDHKELKKEFNTFFDDIEFLLAQKLSTKEVFYFASMIHLVFVKIHPFVDGNGRAARLLEKWFLSSFEGKKTWMAETEKYYWENRKAYYKNLMIGYDYESTNYKKGMNFIKMLPKSLN